MINKEGIDLIKSFESLELKAYLCPAKVWTIGYGHTQGVDKDDVISKEQAEQLFEGDVREFEQGVKKLIKVDVTENQLAALVSFAFNLGIYALSKSTLLRKLNERDYNSAANEFGRWIYAGGNKAPLPGLIRRRKAEMELFLK
jgi:lysozyme